MNGDLLSRARDFLRRCGSDSTAHLSGSLGAHLERTCARLVRWGAPEPLAIAGLCHAVYGTDGFPLSFLPLARRHELRACIGEEAEGIVYAYGSCDRSHWARSHGRELIDRFTGSRCSMPDGIARALAELTAANELDVLEQDQLSTTDRRKLLSFLEVLRHLLSPAAAMSLPSEIALTPQDAWHDAHIAIRSVRHGEQTVILVHGGAPPEVTWEKQLGWALDSPYRWLVPWRRGYGPSARTPRQDWEQDASDLLRIAPPRAHVIAHSYGGVGAAMAAAVDPERFRSLTLVEPPLTSVAEDDPRVRAIAELALAFSTGPSPEQRRAFFELAAVPFDSALSASIEKIARGLRSPGEARPDWSRVRGIPTLVASGLHNEAVELVCDELAAAIGGTRWSAQRGHAVQRHRVFHEAWLGFVASVR